MRSGRLCVCVLAASFLVAAAGPAHAGEPASIESGIARLERATADHPDDPDLLWAHAMALLRAGRAGRAAEQLEAYAARWPARRPDLDFTLGRILFEAGRVQEAQVRLARAVAAQPRSGTARFYHGLTLRELGRRDEARAELIRGGQLAPALLAESTLVLSIDAFAEGNEEAGVELAKKVIGLDPTSDAAARARMLLRDKDLAETRRAWRASAYAGFEYDDNVTLSADKDDSPASDERDVRGVWGLGLTWRQVFSDDVQGLAGYRFDQEVHDDLGQYDTIDNALYLAAIAKVHPRAALRLDVIGWNTRQDGDSFLWAGTVRPSLLLALPGRSGLLRVFGNAELRAFDDAPADPSLEQDGWTFGGGVEWNVSLPKIGGALAIASAYNETITDAKTTSLAGRDFEGDYDLRALRVHARLRVPLWWKVELGADVDYTRSWYRHDSFIAFVDEFLTAPIPEIDLRARRDHVVGARLFLSRPLYRFVTLELEYKPSRRMSNVDLYDYERHVAGVVLRVQSD